jgi:CubicO group peptidase (beta-lactamase class C family)
LLKSLAAALDLYKVAAPICSGGEPGQSATEPIWPTKQWQGSTPEEEGMDSKELVKVVNFGATHVLTFPGLTLSSLLDSLLVVRHGKIVVEAYYAPYVAGIPHTINSVTKAVISTLTAIESKNGLLDSASHRVLDFFDRGSIANIDQRKEVITVQNLLDMTSGIDWMEQLPDGFASAIEMERSPIFSGPLEGVPRVDAIKGSWQDDRTFVIDRLVLGLGAPPERWTLTFAGEKLNVRANIPDRPEMSIDSETGT